MQLVADRLDRQDEVGPVQEGTLGSGALAKMSACFLSPLFWACLDLLFLEADSPHPFLYAFSSLPPFRVMK